jgi:hypothetical protein
MPLISFQNISGWFSLKRLRYSPGCFTKNLKPSLNGGVNHLVSAELVISHVPDKLNTVVSCFAHVPEVAGVALVRQHK